MSAREAYQPPQAPTIQGDDQSSTSAAAQGTASSTAASIRPGVSTTSNQPSFRRREYETPDRKVYYTCGSCGKDNGFRVNEPTRCRNCGGRIMYKIRSKTYVLRFSYVYSRMSVKLILLIGSRSTRRIEARWGVKKLWG